LSFGIDYTNLQGRVTNNYRAWDPNPAVLGWVPGNHSHVAEGDIVAFSVEIDIGDGDVGKIFDFTVSFDFDRSSNFPPNAGVAPYAYINLSTDNSTFNPALRSGPINSTV
jgi:hypothetical protein